MFFLSQQPVVLFDWILKGPFQETSSAHPTSPPSQIEQGQIIYCGNNYSHRQPSNAHVNLLVLSSKFVIAVKLMITTMDIRTIAIDRFRTVKSIIKKL